ncbi:hypothetical protein [Robertmurraya sp. P23]|uniref:hypothetical protein n=1 Tax=Robertmurraya sp. P23 TaxID=3436931 RepID=UPI003D965A5D
MITNKYDQTPSKTRRFYLEKHLIPFFKDKQLSLITDEDIKKFTVNLSERGMHRKQSVPFINFYPFYYIPPLKKEEKILCWH